MINLADEQLTASKLINAIYTGSWLMNEKYFSKPNCVAEKSW